MVLSIDHAFISFDINAKARPQQNAKQQELFVAQMFLDVIRKRVFLAYINNSVEW